MIADAVIGLLLGLWEGAIGLLPTGHLDLPSPGALAGPLGQLDSLVPILGPLSLVLTILAALGVFLALRLLLVVINIVWP